MLLSDAMLNNGLPQMANKKDFSKNDIKIIIEKVNDFDNYYKDSYKKSETRETIKNYVNNYCVACRWYSLIIK